MKYDPSSSESQNEPKNKLEASPDEKAWLKEISRQSWEPELLISGVAIYLTSNLPRLLAWAFEYYEYNFIPDYEGTEYTLTNLIYAVLNSSSIVLIATFILHFCMRAFWVGMVGLYSVFPHGIDFENLKPYSDHYKSQLREKLPPLDKFIADLDKTCSTVFSISFLFVLTLLGVGFVYLIFIFILYLFKLALDTATFEQYEPTIYTTLIIGFLMFTFSSAILSLKRFQKNPKIARLQFNIYWGFGRFMFPIVYKTITYGTFIFYSNIPRLRLVLFYSITFFVFIALLFFSLLGDRNPDLFEGRDYFSNRSDAHRIRPAYYDNLRPDDVSRRRVSIQSDIIEGAFLKLFISYPKYYDQEFNQFCPKIKAADSLNVFRRRELLAAQQLDCIADFYQVYINDSLQKNLAYTFYEGEDGLDKGFLSYIPSRSFRVGKNLLKLTKVKLDSNSKKGYVRIIPFWYAPSLK